MSESQPWGRPVISSKSAGRFTFFWNELVHPRRREAGVNKHTSFLLQWIVPSRASPRGQVGSPARLPAVPLCGLLWSAGIYTNLAFASHPSLPYFPLPSASPIKHYHFSLALGSDLLGNWAKTSHKPAIQPVGVHLREILHVNTGRWGQRCSVPHGPE